MSSDFAPELQPHEYGPTPEDSAHRSLDAAMARTDSPASGERLSASREQAPPDVGVDPTLTLDEANALTGDDIESWLANPFMTPDMLAEKVCWWLTAALAARDADLTARAEARGAKYALLDAAEDVLDHRDKATVRDVQMGYENASRLLRKTAASYTRDGADGEADHG